MTVIIAGGVAGDEPEYRSPELPDSTEDPGASSLYPSDGRGGRIHYQRGRSDYQVDGDSLP